MGRFEKVKAQRSGTIETLNWVFFINWPWNCIIHIYFKVENDAFTSLQLGKIREFWEKNLYIFLILSCFILKKFQLGDFGLNSGFWEQQVVLAYL